MFPHLWNLALDPGVQGTRGVQTLLRALCVPKLEANACHLQLLTKFYILYVVFFHCPAG